MREEKELRSDSDPVSTFSDPTRSSRHTRIAHVLATIARVDGCGARARLYVCFPSRSLRSFPLTHSLCLSLTCTRAPESRSPQCEQMLEPTQSPSLRQPAHDALSAAHRSHPDDTVGLSRGPQQYIAGSDVAVQDAQARHVLKRRAHLLDVPQPLHVPYLLPFRFPACLRAAAVVGCMWVVSTGKQNRFGDACVCAMCRHAR